MSQNTFLKKINKKASQSIDRHNMSENLIYHLFSDNYIQASASLPSENVQISLIKDYIIPYLERMRGTFLDEIQEAYLNIAIMNLKLIINHSNDSGPN